MQNIRPVPRSEAVLHLGEGCPQRRRTRAELQAVKIRRMGWSELCAQEQCCAQNRSVLQPLVLVFPTSYPFLPSLQIFAIKEENNRLRQEKQVLKNKLEELKKRAIWNDPVRVTECVWALGSAGKGTSLAV